MKDLLNFINRLERKNIHYTLNHHSDESIMVKVDIPGERWEVEFTNEKEVLIEIFKNSDGVHSNKELLEDIFFLDNGIGFGFYMKLNEGVDVNDFLDLFVKSIIEPLGFAIGGNPLNKDGAFITMYARGDVHQEKMEEFEAMLKGQESIVSFQIGELEGGNFFYEK